MRPLKLNPTRNFKSQTDFYFRNKFRSADALGTLALGLTRIDYPSPPPRQALY
jgi:hypothetical protein